MYDSVIYLIHEEKTVDKYGDISVTETKKRIFAQVKSIGQSEFYQASAVGMKPEIKFVIADFLDYDGEKTLEYTPFPSDEAITYTILRTYRTGNALEIVCYKGVDE